MEKNEIEYKNVAVPADVHKKLKLWAFENDMTIKEALVYLIDKVCGGK